MQLLPEERETVILTSDNEKSWSVYTCQKKIMRKLEKIGAIAYDVQYDEEGGMVSARYKVDFNQISFRKKIELTEEQKEKRRQVMLQNLQNRN